MMGPEIAEIAKEIARLLIKTNAVYVSREQPFILAAGWASPVYVDCRLLIGEPAVRRAVTQLMSRYLAAALPGPFDVIAGAEAAGIPFAAWLADETGLPLRYVRKRPLGIGRNAQVEGGAVEGMRILLVDDLTTDGTSKLAFVRGLRSAGGIVEHALTIFFNNAFPGAVERLTAAGITLHALATWTDVLQEDSGLGSEDRATIANFLDDPVEWSGRHGGRIAEGGGRTTTR
jgi:orotate phosphoribosyltransferase